MANSKARLKAVQKYNSNNYEEIKLRVKKGEKDKIKAFAESQNDSVNGFINKAIIEKIERDTTGGTKKG